MTKPTGNPPGRKPTGNKAIQLYLPVDVIAELDKLPKGTKSALVAAAVRRFCGMNAPKT